MAGSKRFKFQGSTIAVAVAFDASSPSLAISAITQANPAVVTTASNLLVTGDVVRILNVVGMTEVNDGVYAVERISATQFRLVGVDSTGYGAYVSGGITDAATFSQFCELTNFNRQGGTSPEIPATSLCSTAAEFETGLPDFGSVTMDYNFAPRTAIQLAITDYYSGAHAGDKTAVKVELPNAGGELIYFGSIQQTSEQAGVNGLWTGSLTMRASGPRVDVAA